ncbi:MAG TPA: hypothetical protein VLA64_02695, partial [Azonexus sp.]|nr:hypothetical protein [Azonexus sp.]
SRALTEPAVERFNRFAAIITDGVLELVERHRPAEQVALKRSFAFWILVFNDHSRNEWSDQH